MSIKLTPRTGFLLALLVAGCSGRSDQRTPQSFARFVDSATSAAGLRRRLVRTDSVASQAYPGTELYFGELQLLDSVPHAARWFVAWREPTGRLVRLGIFLSAREWPAWTPTRVFDAIQACHELAAVFLLGNANRVTPMQNAASAPGLQWMRDSVVSRKRLSALSYAVVDSALADGTTRVGAFTGWVDGAVFRLSCRFRPGVPPRLAARLLADLGAVGEAWRLVAAQPGDSLY